jgi:hypothetical protein
MRFALGRLLEPCLNAIRAKLVFTVQMYPRLHDTLGGLDANRVVANGALLKRRLLEGYLFVFLLQVAGSHVGDRFRYNCFAVGSLVQQLLEEAQPHLREPHPRHGSSR